VRCEDGKEDAHGNGNGNGNVYDYGNAYVDWE
jgi:hypothetical protein